MRILAEHAEGHVPSSELARTLDTSEETIWEHVKSLRESGYQIEFKPFHGYRLASTPDQWVASEITAGLGTRVIGSEIHCLVRTTSTMDVAAQLAQNGVPDGTVVAADLQTTGKGRMGRQWFSPPGTGIWTSIVLKPDLSFRDASKITLMAAVAVAHAIRAQTGLEALIKWPNDVQVRDKKVSGILTEMVTEEDRLSYLALGIGINVNQSEEDFHPSIRDTAISLQMASGEDISRLELFRQLLRELDEQYAVLTREGFEPIKKKWETLSSVLGHQVRVELRNRVIEGEATGIDDDGSLLVRLDSGIIQPILAADVFLLR